MVLRFKQQSNNEPGGGKDVSRSGSGVFYHDELQIPHKTWVYIMKSVKLFSALTKLCG
jgi:hypothetical protein